MVRSQQQALVTAVASEVKQFSRLYVALEYAVTNFKPPFATDHGDEQHLLTDKAMQLRLIETPLGLLIRSEANQISSKDPV